jgi:hypothetical protein
MDKSLHGQESAYSMNRSILSVFLFVAACGGKTEDPTAPSGPDSQHQPDGEDGGDGGLAEASSCERTAGGDGGRCSIGRTVLLCKSPTNGGQFCVSESLTSCNDPSTEADAGYVCESHCNDGEYAAACTQATRVPAGCRQALLPPPGPPGGETAFWCCHCD